MARLHVASTMGRVPPFELTPNPGSRRSPLWACALVAVASMALYRPTLDSGFIAIDDPQYVSDNPYILWPTWEKFVAFFTEWEKPATVAGYYQPLTLTSLMVDRLVERGLAGYWPMPPRPFVYHLTNIVIHGLNSGLVCLLAWGLTRNRLAAAVCGLLFGLHPLNVEAVAWVNQRKALLSTFFALLMVFAHVRYAKSRQAGWLIATIVAFLLSLLAKPTGLLLPLVLLLIDVWPLRRFSMRAVVEKLPLAVIAVVMGYVAYRSQHLTTGLSQNVAASDPWRAFLLMCHNLSFYIAKTIVPVRLSPFYKLPPDAEISLGNPSFLLGLIGAVAMGLLMLWSMRRRWHSVWVCIAAFVFMAAPALGSVRFMGAMAADRFAYMPMIAGVALLAHGLRRRLAWDRVEKRTGITPGVRLIAVLLVLFVVPWSIYTLRMQKVWKSTRTYNEAILARDPKGADGLFWMGVCCFEEHDGLMQQGVDPDAPEAQALLDEADRHFRAALAINPGFSKASSYVAEILLLRNRPEEAQQFIDNALAYHGSDEEAHFFRGMALARMGNDEGAVEAYRHYLNVRPGSRETLRNLGNSLMRLGRPREAIEYYSRLFKIDPADFEALHNFGRALIEVGNPQAALYPIRESISLRSDFARGLSEERGVQQARLVADSNYLLACALTVMGRFDDAIEPLGYAIQIKPEMLDAAQRSPTLAPLRASPAWAKATAAGMPRGNAASAPVNP